MHDPRPPARVSRRGAARGAPRSGPHMPQPWTTPTASTCPPAPRSCAWSGRLRHPGHVVRREHFVDDLVGIGLHSLREEPFGKVPAEGFAVLGFRRRGGVGENEGPHPARVAEPHLHGYPAAHGHTDDDRLFDARTVEQSSRIVNEVRKQRQHRTLPVSPQVRGDHAVTGRGQRRRLGSPHRVAMRMSVDQDYGGSVAGTQVLKKELHAIANLGVHERSPRSYIEPLAFT